MTLRMRDHFSLCSGCLDVEGVPAVLSVRMHAKQNIVGGVSEENWT